MISVWVSWVKNIISYEILFGETFPLYVLMYVGWYCNQNIVFGNQNVVFVMWYPLWKTFMNIYFMNFQGFRSYKIKHNMSIQYVTSALLNNMWRQCNVDFHIQCIEFMFQLFTHWLCDCCQVLWCAMFAGSHFVVLKQTNQSRLQMKNHEWNSSWIWASNTLRPENGWHFADEIFKCLFQMKLKFCL